MELFLTNCMYDGIADHTNINNNSTYSIIQNIISIQWEENFADVGTFYIEKEYVKKDDEMFIPGSSVYRNDINKYGIIEKIEIENGVLKVYGYLDALNKIINKVQLNISNTYDGLYSLLNQPRGGVTYSRSISTVNVSTGTFQTTWDNWRETIIDMCNRSNTGYRVNGAFSIEIYQGNILSNNPISDEITSIYKEKLLLDNSETANVAIVAGEDTGTSRVVVSVNNPNFEIHINTAYSEIYIDARDLQRDDGESLPSYEERLKQRGLSKLQEFNPISSFSCELENGQHGYEYRKDFRVGDIFPIWINELDIRKNMRVAKATEVEEPSFASYVRTIIELEEV